MFEQHPVPQQISSYQFRLVGDMTLKQFFQLAAGAVIGLIIYSFPLPGFFKWPLIALAVIGGAAFAFLPIQDRPLEQWLIAFFRSIYAPTIYVWRKREVPVQYFAVGTASQPTPVPEAPDSTPHDVSTHVLEQNEQNFLSRISSMFRVKTPAPQPVPQKVPELVQPKEPEKPKEVVVPAQTIVEIRPQGFKPEAAPTTQQTVSSSVGEVFSAAAASQSQAAQFSPEAAPPAPPTSPNIIIGQVMDAHGKIVEGAILEISDMEGRPVRALKTNKVGHFMIVTPLADGEYKIATEKEGLTFEPVNVKLTGTIVAPIAVCAKDALPKEQEAEGRAVWSPN